MKRVIAVVALILNLLMGHALAAYDPEYMATRLEIYQNLRC